MKEGRGRKEEEEKKKAEEEKERKEAEIAEQEAIRRLEEEEQRMQMLNNAMEIRPVQAAQLPIPMVPVSDPFQILATTAEVLYTTMMRRCRNKMKRQEKTMRSIWKINSSPRREGQNSQYWNNLQIGLID